MQLERRLHNTKVSGFGRLHDAGVTPKEVDFQQSLRLSRRVPGQSITAPRGLLRHASAADGCAADSRSIDTIYTLSILLELSAVGTQKKPPIGFETTSRWRSLAVTTFPAIPGSHSRLAGSPPGSVSLPVSRTWLSRVAWLHSFFGKNDRTPYARAGVS